MVDSEQQICYIKHSLSVYWPQNTPFYVVFNEGEVIPEFLRTGFELNSVSFVYISSAITPGKKAELDCQRSDDRESSPCGPAFA